MVGPNGLLVVGRRLCRHRLDIVVVGGIRGVGVGSRRGGGGGRSG